MDELIASKEKDLTVIDDLKRKLEESEEKIVSLKEEMMEKELSLREARYEEQINNLQQIIQNQNQNIKVRYIFFLEPIILNCLVLGTEQWIAKITKWNQCQRSDGENEGG